MTLRFLPMFPATLLAAAVLTVAPARPVAAQANFLAPLGGDSGVVDLRWDRLPDGTGGVLKTRTKQDGSFDRLEINGRVFLRSTKLNLDSNYLLYDATSGVLLATGDVHIMQDGVDATCERLEYGMESGSVTLSGEPVVKQISPGRASHFSGMDRFLIMPSAESGETEIQLLGGTEIVCAITPADDVTTATTVMSGAAPAVVAAIPEAEGELPNSVGGGLGSLGKSIRIVTRANRGKPPQVLVASSSDNDMKSFEATGSVVLESDDLSLRADQLYFNGVTQMIEALYNVYIKQQGIEADCQRLQYDLTDNRITLTGNPVIRKDEGAQIMRISEIVSFIITRRPDGSSDTEVVPGVGQQGRTEFIPRIPTTPIATPTRPAPKEIDLDDAKALEKLGSQ